MDNETKQQARKKLNKTLKQFEQQFNCKLNPTGAVMNAEDNGGRRSEEFRVEELIESPAENLNFEIGGWFEIVTHEVGDNAHISCNFSFEINGEQVGKDHEALVCRYHHDKDKWANLRWGNI